MYFLALSLRLVLASFAFAQSPSPTSMPSGSAASSASGAAASALASLPQCAQNCINLAANATECVSPLNVSCACTDSDFLFKSAFCLQAECQADELNASEALLLSQCASLSLSATASPTNTAPFLPSNSAEDISVSPSASAASGSGGSGSPSTSGNTGAAVALFAPDEGTALFLTMSMALLGCVIGSLVV